MTCARWTPEEDRILRDGYGKVPTPELAAKIGRSAMAVVHRCRTLKILSGRWWPAEHDELLRQLWGNLPVAQIAARIGRTRSAVKNRAHALQLRTDQLYTQEEKGLVRQLYATHTAGQIAKIIHGSCESATSIYCLAHKMGLRKWPSWPVEVLGRVRQLHAEGLTDGQIAKRMADVFQPGPGGRSQVKSIRHDRFKLPVNVKAWKESIRDNYKIQLRTMGLSSLKEMRTQAYRKFAIENGWPESLRPREVQILNVLAEHGPQTMLELATAIGMRTDRIGSNGRLDLLNDSCRDGTYTASLIKKGLIVYVAKFITGQPHGKARKPGHYLLTMDAIDILEASGAKGAACGT